MGNILVSSNSNDFYLISHLSFPHLLKVKNTSQIEAAVSCKLLADCSHRITIKILSAITLALGLSYVVSIYDCEYIGMNSQTR